MLTYEQACQSQRHLSNRKSSGKGEDDPVGRIPGPARKGQRRAAAQGGQLQVPLEALPGVEAVVVAAYGVGRDAGGGAGPI